MLMGILFTDAAVEARLPMDVSAGHKEMESGDQSGNLEARLPMDISAGHKEMEFCNRSGSTAAHGHFCRP